MGDRTISFKRRLKERCLAMLCMSLSIKSSISLVLTFKSWRKILELLKGELGP